MGDETPSSPEAGSTTPSAGPETPATEIPPEELVLLAGTERRVARVMVVMGVMGVAACWWWGGASWAVGFGVGATVSALSLQWMTTSVNVLANAIATQTDKHPGAKRPGSGSTAAVFRFLFRYALIALAGYAIFSNSAISLEAFFGGLFLSIAALLVEAGFQIYYELRKHR